MVFCPTFFCGSKSAADFGAKIVPFLGLNEVPSGGKVAGNAYGSCNLPSAMAGGSSSEGPFLIFVAFVASRQCLLASKGSFLQANSGLTRLEQEELAFMKSPSMAMV